jgi:hypothetical protein
MLLRVIMSTLGPSNARTSPVPAQGFDFAETQQLVFNRRVIGDHAKPLCIAGEQFTGFADDLESAIDAL